MTVTVRECRAANKATCRVHGTVSPASVIFNEAVARENLIASERALMATTSFEEHAENHALLEHDQLVYDSTTVGMSSLRKDISSVSSDFERVRMQARLDAAEDYRTQILSTTSAFVEAEKTYQDFVAENSIKKVDLTANPETLDELKKLKMGTPIALKFKSGFHAYDRAGNGLEDGKVPALFKAVGYKGSFVQDYLDGRTISVASSNMLLGTGDIAEIHVLREGAYSDGVEKLRSTYVRSPRKSNSFDEVKPLSVKIGDALYESEGRMDKRGFIAFVSGFSAGQSDYVLAPRFEPDIRQIDIS